MRMEPMSKSSLHVASSMICDEGCCGHCSCAACCNREHGQAEGGHKKWIDVLQVRRMWN